MAATKIIGGGNNLQVVVPGVEMAVDPTFLAARIALRPLEYQADGMLLGHYAVAQKSGAFTGWAAAANAGSLRWAPSLSNIYLVLMRLKWGFVTNATATAGVYDVGAYIARGFTVDFTANSTPINMATVPNTNAMRKTMSTSQMGANGPRICTTAGMTGQTATLDNAPFAFGLANVTGTTVGISSFQTIYEYTALSQHPVVFSANEGVILQMLTASAGGTFNVYFQYEFAEVAVF